MAISKLAERTIKIVDDEGYYDREAAGAEIDQYVLGPIGECLKALAMRRLTDMSFCWCLTGPSEIRTAAGLPEHTEPCQAARELYIQLRGPSGKDGNK